jgi:chromate transporter
MVAPMAIVLLLVRMYDEADALRVVQHLVAGLSVGAAGLILATAVKMALPLRGSARGIFVAAAGFVALALLHLPFLPTLCVLLPVSVAFAAASTRE